MPAPLWIGLGLVGSFVGIGFVWRLASRRHTIPCPVWLRWLVELDNPFTATNRAAVIIGHLGLQPGMTVLDVGCGPGRVTLPAAREVGPTGQVIAIDLQPGMLRRARERARAAGLDNIRFVEAGVGDGKLDVSAADRALLVTVLGEIPDREGALRSIFAALKPGGVLSITEIVFDPHFQRRATVGRLAREAGFEEKAFFGNRIAYTLHLSKPMQK
jgi:ubiquinone/menaquinone biosynthesis C-methylase UbiE